MMTSPLEQVLKNNEDLIIRFLEILQGKETKARVNLDGMKFRIGKTDVLVNGTVELSVVPSKANDKKKK
jgi:hypothetical protein